MVSVTVERTFTDSPMFRTLFLTKEAGPFRSKWFYPQCQCQRKLSAGRPRVPKICRKRKMKHLRVPPLFRKRPNAIAWPAQKPRWISNKGNIVWKRLSQVFSSWQPFFHNPERGNTWQPFWLSYRQLGYFLRWKWLHTPKGWGGGTSTTRVLSLTERLPILNPSCKATLGGWGKRGQKWRNKPLCWKGVGSSINSQLVDDPDFWRSFINVRHGVFKNVLFLSRKTVCPEYWWCCCCRHRAWPTSNWSRWGQENFGQRFACSVSPVRRQRQVDNFFVVHVCLSV